MSDRRTLLLVGHGSPGDPRAAAPTYDHAEQLRDVETFDAVHEAFLRDDPSIEDALSAVEDGTVVVVPLFVSDGYLVEEVVPRKLDAADRDGLDVRYARPVGTHEAMTDVVVRRATSAVEDDRTADVGLALVGHGSERSPDSADAVREHASRIRHREDVEFDDVSSFFLEEAPSIAATTAAFEADEVVAVPVFMAKGHHVRDDVPELLGVRDGGPSDVDGTLVRYTDPVGTDPAVADLALDRARATLNETGTDPAYSAFAVTSPESKHESP